MQETKVGNALIDGKLKKLFLHCSFIKPEFIRGEVSKYLEIPIDKVELKCEKEEENSRLYNLSLYDVSFTLGFNKKVEQPKEIDVPKIVKKPKKWWQLSDKTEIIIEKKLPKTKPLEYWVLSHIDY